MSIEAASSLQQERGIFLSGLSFRETPISVRERLSLRAEDQPGLLAQLFSNPGITEAVVLSTCSRTEIVGVGSACELDSAIPRYIEQTFSAQFGVAREEFSSCIYHLSNDDAVGHLFKVAAGLDSMILGEPQVLGQLKSAYQASFNGGATNSVLNRLFQQAFSVAKAVRTETAIGKNAVSVCYAAKVLAEQIFGELSAASVLLIGTGDTGTLALKHFRSAGARRFFVASSSLTRAAEIASGFEAMALDFGSLEEVLPQVDIVIGASSSQRPDKFLADRAQVELALKKRWGRPQFYIDLAVPRNFSPAVAELDGAFLYDIDDLGKVVEQNLDARMLEVGRAGLIIDLRVEKFLDWLARRKQHQLVRAAQLKFEEICRVEVEKTIRRLARDGCSREQLQAIQGAVEVLLSSVHRKFMHRALGRIKTAPDESGTIEEIFREFFGATGQEVPLPVEDSNES